jgi:hypothetical protein
LETGKLAFRHKKFDIDRRDAADRPSEASTLCASALDEVVTLEPPVRWATA